MCISSAGRCGGRRGRLWDPNHAAFPVGGHFSQTHASKRGKGLWETMHGFFSFCPEGTLTASFKHHWPKPATWRQPISKKIGEVKLNHVEKNLGNGPKDCHTSLYSAHEEKEEEEEDKEEEGEEKKRKEKEKEKNHKKKSKG